SPRKEIKINQPPLEKKSPIMSEQKLVPKSPKTPKKISTDNVIDDSKMESIDQSENLNISVTSGSSTIDEANKSLLNAKLAAMEDKYNILQQKYNSETKRMQNELYEMETSMKQTIQSVTNIKNEKEQLIAKITELENQNWELKQEYEKSRAELEIEKKKLLGELNNEKEKLKKFITTTGTVSMTNS